MRGPFELIPGERVHGDAWQDVEMFGPPHARIEFSDNWGAKCTARPSGDIHLVLQYAGGQGSPDMDCGSMPFKTLAQKLSEVMLTARKNYGENWGK